MVQKQEYLHYSVGKMQRPLRYSVGKTQDISMPAADNRRQQRGQDW